MTYETVYWARCIGCDGKGVQPAFPNERCTLCGGHGKIYAVDPFGPKQPESLQMGKSEVQK